ncbi:MAG: HEPN domain-containing protein [Oscillospiraceae bacterium]|nr:HEPN domain-containing protein [Oscillospiraceae bacterium]
MDEFVVAEWLRCADNDFETVKILSGHYPMQLEIICYHCQQTAEKTLKAFLLYNDREPPKTHNLESLVDLCKEISDEFDEIVEDCEYLNPFGVQPRYPFGLELVDSDAVISIKKCGNIFNFIKNRIVFNNDKSD